MLRRWQINQGAMPYPLSFAASVVSTAVVIWLVWATWASSELASNAIARSVEFERLAGEITYLDEVLTMSARMAAGTGDLAWAERYYAHVPDLDGAIALAIKVVGDEPAASGVFQTNQANVNLIEMEEHAFELVRNGRSDEALALLLSDAYETQKALYTEGNNTFISMLRNELANSVAANKRRLAASLVVGLVALIFVIGFWWLIARQLREQQSRLKAADLAKSTFLANMSHEIRTPMNGVLGMADLLLSSNLPGDIRNKIDIIKESGDTLLNVLNDILDLTKIEAGKLEMEQIDVDVVALLKSVILSVDVQLKKKGLWCKCDISNELVSSCIITDPTRVRQILTNLVTNAIKFTDQGGITLVLAQSETRHGGVETHFEVSDTGIGMTAKQQEGIFKPFIQADSTTTREYGGTGLGLSICRQLAKALGGQIGVTSEPGKGSSFWFTLASDKCVSAQSVDTEITMPGHT